MHEIIIIFLAKYLVYLALLVAVGVIAYFLYKTRKFWFVSKVVLAGILSLVLSRLVKLFYFDPRPFVVHHTTPLIPHVADNGFPSDHVLLLATLGFLLVGISRTWGVFVLLLAALVGAGRVLAGVHHSIDVIGSFIISLISVYLINMAFAFWRKRKKENQNFNK